MTELEQQQAAVFMAVRFALHNMSLKELRSDEFLGTNQRTQPNLEKAA